LADDYPALLVLPVCADFTQPLDLPPLDFPTGRRVVLFSGSTLGNLSPAAARSQLILAAELCGPGGGLLLGVDMQKERSLIERAYNDRSGVTAAFNLNLLRRMNRELGTNFRPDHFSHYALFDAQHQRMEMHLVSRRRQEVTLGDEEFEFSNEEMIHTENSYKFSPEGVTQLAESAGWRVAQTWTDSHEWFSLNYLEVA
jgi:dimethylhistidine N-methyltransferase